LYEKRYIVFLSNEKARPINGSGIEITSGDRRHSNGGPERGEPEHSAEALQQRKTYAVLNRYDTRETRNASEPDASRMSGMNDRERDNFTFSCSFS